MRNFPWFLYKECAPPFSGGLFLRLEKPFQLSGEIILSLERAFRISGKVILNLEKVFQLFGRVILSFERAFRLFGKAFRKIEKTVLFKGNAPFLAKKPVFPFVLPFLSLKMPIPHSESLPRKLKEGQRAQEGSKV